MITRTFNELKKNLKKDFGSCQPVKIALLGDTATQLLTQAIKGYGYETGICFDIFEADYNQIERQILDPASELYRFAPEFVIIFHSSQKLLNKFYALPKDEKLQFAEKHLGSVNHLYETIQTHLLCKTIYLNFFEICDNVFGNYCNKVQISFTYQLRKINFELMHLSQGLKNLFIVDVSLLHNQYGRSRVFDPKIYVNTDIVLNVEFLPALAHNITGVVASIKGKIKKCLILDLDNTLWGGIIGDDGIENIQLGDLGIGKAFTEFQLWIKQLKERGIILAVCSKNDEDTAKEPFQRHPDRVLSLDDFAVFVANWDNKVKNIRKIQNLLNISFDSMVFLDDTPLERDMVRKYLPQITVPELPEDPADYLEYLRPLNLFETASFSEEDEKRHIHYQTEAKRIYEKERFVDENEYLGSLNMQARAVPFDKFNIPRIAQLTQRSNQFNLRTVRYTEEEISKIAASDKHLTFTFTLQDKFGDNGLIGIIIMEKNNTSLFIDTWIMSCRVLNRGMEEFILNKLVETARANGTVELMGEYIPTAKNNMVKDLYQRLGFRRQDERWRLDIRNYKPFICHITEVK